MQWAKYYLLKAKYKIDDSDFVSSVKQYLKTAHANTLSKDASLRYDVIRALMNGGKYTEALTEAQSMVKLLPNDTLTKNVQFQIGELYLRSGKPNEAQKQYTQLLKEAPAHSEEAAQAEFQLGVVNEHLNAFAKAKEIYLRVQKEYPSIVHYVIASKYALAMLVYREAMSKNDSAITAVAYADLKKFTVEYPHDHHTPRALMALATLCKEQGNITEGFDIYDTLIQFDSSFIPLKPKAAAWSNDVKAHNQLVLQAQIAKGLLLQSNMGNFESALHIYNTILQKNPLHEEVRFQKAICLKEMNRTEEAKQLLNELVQEGGSYTIIAKELLGTL